MGNIEKNNGFVKKIGTLLHKILFIDNICILIYTVPVFSGGYK